MKEYFKKLGAMFALFFSVVGLFGSLGYLCAYAQTGGAWSDVVVPMVGLLVLAGLAWSNFAKLCKYFKNGCGV